VEYMLQVIWSSGRFADRGVTVYLGIFSNDRLILQEKKVFRSRAEFGGQTEVELLANIYRESVLEQPTEPIDYGHCHWDMGQQPGVFSVGTEVYHMRRGWTGTVTSSWEQGGKLRVYVEPKLPRASESNNREHSQKRGYDTDGLSVVAIKSNHLDQLATVTLGRAVVAKGQLVEHYGRIVHVDSVGEDVCGVHYYEGEKVQRLKISKRFLSGLDGEREPSAGRWVVAMFVPDDFIKNSGLHVKGEVCSGPVTMMMKDHFIRDGSPFTLVKHSFPSRARASVVPIQCNADSLDDYGETVDECDDPYDWLASHKSTERWTWSCDRCAPRTQSQAEQGKSIISKKIG
jgi:hypothetical protein